MPIPALMGWIGGLSAGAKLSMASSVVSGLSSYAAAKAQRKQAIKDQDQQFVRMRNAAQRAGFNPLTVMRATGGQGFTGLPTISKAAAFGNMATGIFDAVRQSPIDKYNKQVRDLEIKQRQADLDLNPLRGKLMKAQIDSLAGEVDPYLGYEGFIPVKVGVNEQYLQIDVAKRLGILPNTPVTAGDLEEIKGELQGGVEAAIGSKIGTEVLRNAPILGNDAGIERKELPPLGKDNLDQLLEDLSPIIGVKKGRNRPRVRSN
jgi:hypothetical protein